MATQSSPFKFNNDLLVLIMEQVGDMETLTALSLCSRAFHLLVEPVLYSVINLNGGFRGVRWGRKFAKFLRAILESPTLGSRVKVLHSAVDQVRSGTITDVYTNNDCERLKAAIERTLGSEHIEDAYGEAVNKDMRHNWDVLITVLLCHLPNIEELDFPQFDTLNKYLEMVLGRAASLQRIRQTQKDSSRVSDSQIGPQYLCSSEDSTKRSDAKMRWIAFQKLSRVKISADNIGSVDVMHTLPVLALPSLKNLSMCWDKAEAQRPGFDLTISQDHRTSLYKFPYPQFSFSLTTLSIQLSSMSNISLAQYLSLFRCLKSEISRNDTMDEWIEPQQILNSLAHSRKCLEHIHIWDWKSWDTQVEPKDNDEFGDPMSSLASFPKLKDVDVDFWMLVGQGKHAIESFLHAFPMSLERLIMRGYSCQSLDALLRLLEEKLPPRLLNVKITRWGGAHYMRFQGTITTLKEQAILAGVALQVY